MNGGGPKHHYQYVAGVILLRTPMEESSKAKDEIVIAVVWYRPEQWKRVRDISTDEEGFEESYAEWLQQAKERFEVLLRSGMRVEKVDVDSEQLILWCNERGVENNANARTQYAAERLAELEQQRSIFQRRP